MKRILGILLACLFLTALLPGALAQGEFDFDPDRHTITGYRGSGAVVTVPASIDGVTVLAIGAGVFDQHQEIEEVILPEGLTHILGNAFYFCDNLARIQLPASLQAVDSYAFFSCGKLERLVFPGSLVYVDDNAFAFCDSLAEVTFQGAAPYIAPNAFDNGPENRQFKVPAQEVGAYESLLSVTCQAGGDLAAGQPDSRVTVDAAGAVTGYPGVSADVLILDQVDGVTVTKIAERAFFTNPWVRRIALPEGVTEIGRQAFYGSKLGIITLPEGLASIGEEAFAAANLKELVLPNSLQSLGRRAFAGGRFTELVLPPALTTLPEGVFTGNNQLKDVTFPAGIQAIGGGAFRDCGALDYLVFEGETAPEIAAEAFAGCPLADIDIHWQASKQAAAIFAEDLGKAGIPMAEVTVWRANPPHQPPYPAGAVLAFDEASQLITKCEGDFEALTMYWDFWKADGSGTLYIKGLGPGIFEGSTLKTFYVPHSGAFEVIGERAFAGSQIDKVYLFDSVTSIGKEAFLDCLNLTELTLPDSLEIIEEGAFKGCANLKRLVFKGQAVTIEAGAFEGCDSLAEVVLPPDTQVTGELGAPASAYRVQASATEAQRLALEAALQLPWYLDLPREGEEHAAVVMPDSFSPNPAEEFEFDATTGFITKYTGTASRVVVPRAISGVPVVGIDFLAFSNLNLYAVATGTADNQGLEEVVLPETIRQIADSAFLNCTNLKRVESFGPLDRISIRAFESCTSLTEILCHSGVKELGDYCFHLCASLNKAELGHKLQELPEGAFEGCGFEGLLTISTPRVGMRAYKDNKQVTTLHILEGVEHLGEGVFLGMDALREVCFAQTDPGLLKAGYQFDDKAVDLAVHVPAATSDEGLAAFQQALKLNLLPGDTMVSRKDCALQKGMASAPADATEAPAEQPVETPAPVPAGPAEDKLSEGAGPLLNHRYSCVSATTGGIELDLAVIGEYALEFFADGTMVFTIYGTALPPMGYAVQEGIITLEYVAGPLVLKPVDGGYEMDFMGAMMMIYKPD